MQNNIQNNIQNNNENIIETVVKIIAIDTNNFAEVQAQNGCGKCHTKGGCGGNNLSRIFCSNAKNTMKIANTLNAKIGDFVIIGFDKNTLQNSANLLYGLPLLALIFGALFGNIFGEVFAILFGFLAMFITFILLKISKKNNQNLVENVQSNQKPFMIKIST